jgi:hypothetical protein
LTSFVPSKVHLGVSELTFKESAVGLGVIEDLLVKAHDLSELAHGGHSDFLISLVLDVSNLLGFNVGLLKVVQQVENSVNSITCFGANLQ